MISNKTFGWTPVLTLNIMASQQDRWLGMLPPTGPSPPITDLSCPPMAGEMGGRHRGREKLGGRQDEEVCSLPVAAEKA